jgi:hypothetical protein
MILMFSFDARKNSAMIELALADVDNDVVSSTRQGRRRSVKGRAQSSGYL